MSRLKSVPLHVWMLLIGVAYVALGLAARLFGYHQEDAVWFTYVATRILDGSFDIYRRFDQPWAAPPLGMAFTYPPLMPLLLAPFVAVGWVMHLSTQQTEVLIGLPWLVCDVLLAAQIASLTGEWTGRRADQWQETRWRLVAFLLCLLTFVVPVSSAHMGHHESLVLLLILTAIRARSALVAGICWGLAISAKQTAAFALLPVAFLALRDAWLYRGPGFARLVRLLLPAALLPLLLIAPFWLKWPSEVSYSLVGVEGRRILYGVNLPNLLDALAVRLAPSLQGALNAFLVRWTSPIFLLLCTAFALGFSWRQSRSLVNSGPDRLPWQAPAMRAATIATMGTIYAAFMVAGKWSEMHYRFMPLMLLLVLDLLERPEFPFIYVFFALSASSYAFAESVSGFWRMAVFAVMAGYFASRSWHVSAVKESEERMLEGESGLMYTLRL